jgi:hypothetical protein
MLPGTQDGIWVFLERLTRPIHMPKGYIRTKAGNIEISPTLLRRQAE